MKQMGLGEKKWFILRDDTQEGPLSSDDILKNMGDGTLLPSDYAWHQEMENWVQIESIKNFDLSPARANFPRSFSQPKVMRPDSPRPQLSDLPEQARRVKAIRRKARLKSALGVISILTWAALLSWEAYHHTDGNQRRTAIEQAEGLSPSDRETLLNQSLQPLREHPPSAAIAILHPESLGFEILISSNLPDHATLELQLEGVQETLLGAPFFSQRTSISFQKGLAKVRVHQLAQSGSIPRGEYRIQVSLPNTKQPLALMQPAKTYFLGGVRNQDYLNELAVYRNSLKAQAQAELVELNEFCSVLEDQLKQTSDEFGRVLLPLKSGDEKPLKHWSKFHKDWIAFATRLEPSFQKWTADWLKSHALFGKLYHLAAEAGKTVSSIHEMQDHYLNLPSTHPDTELRILKSASLAQSMLLSLKVKIQLAEQLPKGSDGVPNAPSL